MTHGEEICQLFNIPAMLSHHIDKRLLEYTDERIPDMKDFDRRCILVGRWKWKCMETITIQYNADIVITFMGDEDMYQIL